MCEVPLAWIRENAKLSLWVRINSGFSSYLKFAPLTVTTSRTVSAQPPYPFPTPLVLKHRFNGSSLMLFFAGTLACI